ncbi:MAG: bifunctional riboflavin kinase/FAD synthetase [Polyangiaceae bacterium]
MSAQLVRVEGGTTREAVGAAPCALVVGNFDGVHRGHQAVLSEAVAHARASRLAACVLTFDPHPGLVVGRGAPPLLTTLERRAELAGALGVERVYVRHFDAEFAAWSPERFVRDLVAGVLAAKVVVVGENFRFGAKRTGDLTMLRGEGARLGLEARVHSVAADAHGAFSSTRARDAIGAGRVDEAIQVLGRPHSVSGVVVHGDGRGRTIGVPTANLEGVPELLPSNGVYAVRVDALVPEGSAGSAGPSRPLGAGVTNVGVRPTVDGTTRRIETHLFDFSGDLYGQRLRVHLLARIRDEKKFAGLDELEAQIARDIEAARAVQSP